MSRTVPLLILFVFGLDRLAAQAQGDFDGAIHVGPGVTRPRLLRKVEPEYSPDARADRIQGTVVLQMVITEKGRPAGVTVISPLGFGLDERAQAAVEKCELSPGMKDGKPVKIVTQVTINFRFPKTWFDEKAERYRTEFNLDLQALRQPGASTKIVDGAVKSMQDLAHRRFPPAMHVTGLWEIKGDHVTKDPAEGLALIQKAAARNYGPALYEIAIREIEGRDLPKDVEKGLDAMRHASVLGSAQAQFYLGHRYETGRGVPRELDRARRHFRLCAAQGIALCQYRLGLLMLDGSDGPARDPVQAVAWLQLAAELGVSEAKELASTEASKLTGEQMARVATLKAQLLRK